MVAAAQVGNDSGITHLAAALAVPTVAIFGPTDAAVWSPWGAKVKIITGMDAGSAARSSAAKAVSPGLENIDAKRVIQALDCSLGSSPPPG